jgi:hypothetical protein
MRAGLQISLILVAWLFAALAPTGPVGFANRRRPPPQRRGVSILPGWPLLPLLFLAPMPFLGADHLVMRILAWLHAALLLWALVYLAYWLVRIRRAG